MKLSSAWPRLLSVALAASVHHDIVTARPVRETVFSPDTRGSLGAVASEAAECSAIGRDLIANGGNAADALVGTTFCVGVIGMYHSGIGGGGFAMVRDAHGGYEAVDFRETAPAAAHQDMYRDNVNGSIVGGLAVGVPSEVRGLEYIHKKYGVLPWKMVMQGAIHIARDGFKVTTDTVRYMEKGLATGSFNFLKEDPSFAQDFAPNGTLLSVGDIMTRKRYADTLEKIAEQGGDAFYTGKMAEAMVKYIQQTNGTMTLADLSSYKVLSRPVKSVRYRGVDLHTIGAPASGAVCLNILKTMEQFDVSPADVDNDAANGVVGNLTAHRFAEAMRFAYGARVELGDPDYVDGVRAFEDRMLSDANARRIRASISDDHTQPVDAYDPDGTGSYAPPGHGTSHVVTADASGMATSLTTTINLLFGAQIMDPASGVILNNEMNDFSIPGVRNEFGFEPSEANYIRPGKRPLSSVTPVIASDPSRGGALVATVGAAGGSRIITATTAALWHVLEHAMSMRDALAAPRMHDQLMPNTLLLEHDFDNGTAASLAARGHDITRVAPGLSAVQGIMVLDDGAFEAASEPRQRNSAGFSI
ncbi:gamma-glutamyltranspeptidase [Purpureocillium lavendulum]|uniref:Glutathione hydrolase n=1 Tax=Purpureocillium lavendulum TaxID=1247861 RepID=A0AB34FSI2_9HYPO|nr:gamma-glutamyltranspeptidase [Purpureocillium lavendulum]